MNWTDFRCKRFYFLFSDSWVEGRTYDRITNELVQAEEMKIVKMTSSLNNLFADDICLSLQNSQNVPTACGSFFVFFDRVLVVCVCFFSGNGTWGHDPKEHTERLNCFCVPNGALAGDSESFAEPHGIYLSQVELWHTHNSCEMLFLAGETTRKKGRRKCNESGRAIGPAERHMCRLRANRWQQYINLRKSKSKIGISHYLYKRIFKHGKNVEN